MYINSLSTLLLSFAIVSFIILISSVQNAYYLRKLLNINTTLLKTSKHQRVFATVITNEMICWCR